MIQRTKQTPQTHSYCKHTYLSNMIRVELVTAQTLGTCILPNCSVSFVQILGEGIQIEFY